MDNFWIVNWNIEIIKPWQITSQTWIVLFCIEFTWISWIIIWVTELFESGLNIRYWGLIDHSWDGKQIVNLALLVYREGLHEDLE